MNAPLFLIPALAEDAALHPAKMLAAKPLAAAEVMNILNRLAKKEKRLFAWVHATLIAYVRERLGKSPENVEATLKAVGIEAAVARRGAAWWRDALALRDSLAPMTKSWGLNDAEKAAADRAGKDLFDHPDYAPAKAALLADLSLMACATGAGTPLEILEDLAADFQTDPVTLAALRLASDAAGAGDPADDIDDTSEIEANELSENGYRKRSEALCDLIQPKLAASNQVFLGLMLASFLKTLVWMTRRPEILKRGRKASGLEQDAAFHRFMEGVLCLEDFSRCLAFRLEGVDMDRIRLPSPKTEEAAEERCEKMAETFMKAIDGPGDDLIALKNWLLIAAVLNTFLNVLEKDEGVDLVRSLDDGARDYYALCVSTLSKLGKRIAQSCDEP